MVKKGTVINISVVAVAIGAVVCQHFLLTSEMAKAKLEESSVNFEEVIVSAEDYPMLEFAEDAKEYIFKHGCISNAQNAAEIALAILKASYDDNDIGSGLPLIVAFSEEKQEWWVKTQIPRGEGVLGHPTNIVLNKSNAEIIAIWSGDVRDNPNHPDFPFKKID